MKSDLTSLPVSVEDVSPTVRKAWHTPVIEDAEVGTFTTGGGDSGMEGSPFLKTGS